MPNWCHNTMDVSGCEDDVARFAEAVRVSEEQPLSFARLVPPPAGATLGWAIEYWGCKWDARFGGPANALAYDSSADVEAAFDAHGLTITPTVAVFKFDTPWSPPLRFVETASEQFPQLTFVLRFAEVGANVAGETSYVGGVRTELVQLEVADVLAPEEMCF